MMYVIGIFMTVSDVTNHDLLLNLPAALMQMTFP